MGVRSHSFAITVCHFENQADANNPDYKKEVQGWLDSPERQQVYQAIHDQVNQLRPSESSIADSDPVYISLAADKEVKDHFYHYLLS